MSVFFRSPINLAGVLLILTAILPISCNNLPNNVTEDFQLFDGRKNVYRSNIVEGNYLDFLTKETAIFAGLKKCTTLVNGSLDSVHSDSIYLKISPLQDTVLVLNGEFYGAARFTMNQIINWELILDILRMDSGSFKRRVFLEYLEPLVLSSLQECISSAESYAAGRLDSAQRYLDSSQTCLKDEEFKQGVLANFNTIKDDIEFVIRHKAEWDSMPGKDPTAKGFPGSGILWESNIFVENNGALEIRAETVYAEEMVRWFNIRVLRTMVCPLGMLVYSPFFRVTPILYQYGPTLENIAEKTVTRYFLGTDTALYQLGYSDLNGFHRPSDSLVMPYQPGSDQIWTVTPLLLTPMTALPDENIRRAIMFPGRAKVVDIFYDDVEQVTRFHQGYYYMMQGRVSWDGLRARIAGYANLKNEYVYLAGSRTYMRIGRETDTRIEIFQTDGNRKTIIEQLSMQNTAAFF